MAKNGICVNIGNCDNANQKKMLEIGTGQDFVCPQCGKSLIVYSPPKGKSVAMLAVVGLIALLVVLVIGWRMFAGGKEATPAPVPPPVATPAPTPPAAVAPPATPPATAPTVTESSTPRLPPCGANDDERRRLKLCD
ncbi:MAG TPA: hypothetical protein PKN13_10010 [Accumulibacter sp.]|nr:hypothetical protein [Accumulibacter sp.]HMW17682.1 hypothetical protein [Accumulibacter sp.]HNC18801.1 hypothetical protein [Accumulibacter sp.]HND80426.1 hypothetical protein [Accumulibacter sp.]HNE13874.1 hypothetical protein [Accumulibacter sp.]